MMKSLSGILLLSTVAWQVEVTLAFTPTASVCSVVRTTNSVACQLSAAPSTTTAAAGTTKLDGRKIRGDITPLNNFLLVKKAPPVEKTGGGILLTGKAKIVKTEGTVVSVGPGKTHPDSGIVFEMPVVAGEGVIYGKYDGTEIDINGAAHTLIRDDDILVKFTGGTLTLDSVSVVRDSVLVFVDKSEQASDGGILLAKSSAENKPSTGEVVKVGPGKMASNGELMPMDVAVGDMIKFRDFAGNEVEIEGKDYTVVRMADILAKF